MNTLKSGELFLLMNRTPLGSKFEVIFEMTDTEGNSISKVLSKENQNEVMQLLNEYNVSVLSEFANGCLGNLIIKPKQSGSKKTATFMSLRIESTDVPVRTLRLRYGIFTDWEKASTASEEQCEKLCADTLVFNLGEAGDEYVITPKKTISLSKNADASLNRYTDGDIAAMIAADIRILKCYERTSETEEYIKQLEVMRDGNAAADYESVLAIEEKVAKIIADALADIRKYRESFLKYNKKPR